MSFFLRNLFRKSKTALLPATWEPKLIEIEDNAAQQPDLSASLQLFASCYASPSPYAFRFLIGKAPSLQNYILWPGQKPVSPWQQRLAGVAGVLFTSPESAFRNKPQSLPALWMFAHSALSYGYQATKRYIPPSVDTETGTYWSEPHALAIPASKSDACNAVLLAHELRHAEQKLAKLAPTYKQTPEACLEMLLALEADAMAYALRVLWTIPDKSLREDVFRFSSEGMFAASLFKAFSAAMETAPSNDPFRGAALDRATENALRAFYETMEAKAYIAVYLSTAQKAAQEGGRGSAPIPSDFYQKLLLTPNGHSYAVSSSEISTLARQTIQRALRDFSPQNGRGTSRPSP